RVALRAVAIASCLAGPLAIATGQEPGDAGREEGDLQSFLDADAEDLSTRLEVLRHALDQADQRMVFLTFLQLHGDRVRAEQVLYPNRGGDLTPGHVFGPTAADPAEARPGLVLVHGGYHA